LPLAAGNRQARAIAAAAAAVLLLAAGLAQAAPYKGFPRGHALIAPAELKAMLDSPDAPPAVLAVVGRVPWLLEHIPGSRHVRRSDYTDRAGMAADRARFERFARRMGIDNDSRVVIYDDLYDAPRLWWLFHLYGKTDVRVLDGGWAAWKKAGYRIGRGPGPRARKTGNFTAAPARPGWIAERADVLQARGDARAHVWDARDRAEWDGSVRLRGAASAGRIGWARFLGWRAFRTAEGGRPGAFRTAAEIGAVLRNAGVEPGADRDHIFYCHTGTRAATPLFALYLMGYPVERLRNYDGSWVAWSNSSPAPAGKGG